MVALRGGIETCSGAMAATWETRFASLAEECDHRRADFDSVHPALRRARSLRSNSLPEAKKAVSLKWEESPSC